MKQVLQNLRTGQTSVTEVPLPIAKSGCALVRTAVSLVSAGTERMVVEFAEKSVLGKARARPDLVRQLLDKARREGILTTLEAAINRLDQPMALGYSSAGTIVALGEGLERFHVGQRVACAGGNYAVHAEYVVVPQNLLTPLPDNVDFEAAAFTTLGAIALHGFRLAETQLGEKVAVIGLGLLGLLTVGLAQAAGCKVLGVDLNPSRVKLAEQMGAKAVGRELAIEAAASFSLGRGCDAVLICADTPSTDPVELAGVIARDRARVVAIGAVGLQIPRKVYYEKELTFLNSRSYGPGRYDPKYEEGGQDYPVGYVRWTEGRNLEAFVDLLESSNVNINSLITHRFPIEQAARAYELITGKLHEPFLGVLLTYAQPEMETSLSLEKVLTTSTTSSSDEVKLGVLGAGNFASMVMLPAIKKTPRISLVGISSASGLSASHAAQKFGFQYSASSSSQLLDDPTINSIAILTRHHLHARQIIAALSAGKHVFCEKPLALSISELTEISEALQNTPSSILMVGFNRRFAPLAVRMKTFVDHRHEPLYVHYRVNAGYIPLNHWVHDPAQGGGRIIGEACHFIDFLTFLVGKPPIAVTAHALPNLGRYAEDNISMTFDFPDGSIGIVSYLANGDKTLPKERIEAFTGGRVAILNDFRSLEFYKDGKRQIIRSLLQQDKGHRSEWAAFVEAIIQGGPAPISYDQLFSITKASFAAVEALQRGNKVMLSS